MGIEARTGKSETRDAEIHVCARRSGEEVDESRIHQHTKQNEADLMTKCHTSEAHKKGCAMMGLRLA